MATDRGREFLDAQQRAMMLANPFFALQVVEQQLAQIEETYRSRFPNETWRFHQVTDNT